MSDQPTEDQVLPGLFLKFMLVVLAILFLRVVMSRAVGRKKGSEEEPAEATDA
jgi:hypothetical protein